MSYTKTTLDAPDGAPSLVVHTHHAPEQGLAVNSYAVETPNGVFLIDAQLLRSEARQFKAVVEAIGRPPPARGPADHRQSGTSPLSNHLQINH
jgi:hypothetical protein